MNNKAVPKSISFRPGSLYDDATAYGESLEQKLNPSEVVCKALRELLDSEGFARSSTEEHSEIAELIAAAKEIGLSDAIAAVRDAKRKTRRRAA